jgi:hypothetical protein
MKSSYAERQSIDQRDQKAGPQWAKEGHLSSKAYSLTFDAIKLFSPLNQNFKLF